jgi:hypothetical protein
MPRSEAGFALERDCVCDETAAGGKHSPTSVEEIVVGDASSDEDRIGWAQTRKGCGHSSVYDPQGGYTETRCITPNSKYAVLSRFESDARAGGVMTHPLDPDRAGASAHVPKGLVE